MIVHRPKAAWRRHSLRERRLATIRDELIAEQSALSRFDPAHRALGRATRAIGTALRCLHDEAAA